MNEIYKMALESAVEFAEEQERCLGGRQKFKLKDLHLNWVRNFLLQFYGLSSGEENGSL